ncbi:MAG: ATP-dependent DNA helicase RecG [Endomicrobiaceae bacterium]|nr:ATP-dependent DNA helicase RecG [Endomicrobiaceae bacterium]
MNLSSDIKYIKGIGPRRSSLLAKLEIHTIEDLLTFFPKTYQDRTKIIKIKNILFNQHCCIFGKIINVYEKSIAKNLSVFCVDIDDTTAVLSAKFFRKVNPYSKFDIFSGIRSSFIVGKQAYLYGICEIKFGQRQMSIEDYEVLDNEFDKTELFNRLLPIYDLTAGITQKTLLSIIKKTVNEASVFYPDISNIDIIKSTTNIMPIQQAIRSLHFPKTLQEAEAARQSFALQEFLMLQIILLMAKKKNRKNTKIQKYTIKKTLLTPFKNQLSFDFTKAQKKVINEIFSDMTSNTVMNRMLMGDVGSGKTVVALSAILLAIENGYQAAIIVPTEILAEQHFLTFKNILKNLNINIDLVTSSTLKTKKQREEILANISEGKTNIIIGTHSVMEDRIKFKNISLVIIDEQHRFGVMQKVSALSKGATPDVLMMTATPIPRGLAMTIYGEMSISVIDELPPNRTAIETFCLTENVAYQSAIKEISNGGQVYIVYPLIDESDKVELKSAVKEAEILSQTVFKNNRVALLHGKMKPKEKNEIMISFKNKEFDVLISTTVIEVGIDVPNATIIIIQHADRYGLATLHQLRGRVGRGKKKSYCLLISDVKSKTSQQRLKIMTKTTDGFKIASEDLEMRGPGEFLGTKQHGFPEFKAGDIVKDIKLIELAKNTANKIIDEDPKLSLEKNLAIKYFLNNKYLNIFKVVQVG